jgi:transcriptional regulator with XRE-family HTH domain
MPLVTGNQLRAARIFAGVDQQQVADAAKVNVNTIRNMEARGNEPITSSAVIVRAVQLVLEGWGVEFTNHTGPGVRLRPGAKPPAKKTAPAKKAKRAANPRRRNGPQEARTGHRTGSVQTPWVLGLDQRQSKRLARQRGSAKATMRLVDRRLHD